MPCIYWFCLSTNSFNGNRRICFVHLVLYIFPSHNYNFHVKRPICRAHYWIILLENVVSLSLSLSGQIMNRRIGYFNHHLPKKKKEIWDPIIKEPPRCLKACTTPTVAERDFHFLLNYTRA